jgi:hypothetical protein
VISSRLRTHRYSIIVRVSVQNEQGQSFGLPWNRHPHALFEGNEASLPEFMERLQYHFFRPLQTIVQLVDRLPAFLFLQPTRNLGFDRRVNHCAMLSVRVPFCKSPTVIGPLALRSFVILGNTRRDCYRAAVEPPCGRS